MVEQGINGRRPKITVKQPLLDVRAWFSKSRNQDVFRNTNTVKMAKVPEFNIDDFTLKTTSRSLGAPNGQSRSAAELAIQETTPRYWPEVTKRGLNYARLFSVESEDSSIESSVDGPRYKMYYTDPYRRSGGRQHECIGSGRCGVVDEARAVVTQNKGGLGVPGRPMSFDILPRDHGFVAPKQTATEELSPELTTSQTTPPCSRVKCDTLASSQFDERLAANTFCGFDRPIWNKDLRSEIGVTTQQQSSAYATQPAGGGKNTMFEQTLTSRVVGAEPSLHSQLIQPSDPSVVPALVVNAATISSEAVKPSLTIAGGSVSHISKEKGHNLIRDINSGEFYSCSAASDPSDQVTVIESVAQECFSNSLCVAEVNRSSSVCKRAALINTQQAPSTSCAYCKAQSAQTKYSPGSYLNTSALNGNPQYRVSYSEGFNKSVSTPGHCLRFGSSVDICRKENRNNVASAKLRLGRNSFICASQANILKLKNNPREPISETDRKRLCKSLSNITADDLLGAPCSSIHRRKGLSQAEVRKPTPSSVAGHTSPQQSDSGASDSKTTNNFFTETRSSNRNLNRGHSFSSNAASSKKTKHEKRTKSNQDMSQLILSNESENAIRPDDKKSKLLSKGKTPKFAKTLLPFMRKNRKRQGEVDSAPGKPMKAKDLVNQADTCQQANTNSAILEKVSSPGRVRIHKDGMSSVGFRKLKITSQQTDRNVHADYATRVSRVRHRLSSSEDKMCAAAANNHDSNEQTRLRGKPRPRRQTSRPRVEETPHHATSNPSHLRHGVPDPEQWAESIGKDAATGRGVETVTIEHETSKFRNHSLAQTEGISDQSGPHQQSTNRFSLNLDYLRSSSFMERINFINSIPGPETTIGSSTCGSLVGVSTPSIITPGLGSVARCSLASSYASVFEEDKNALIHNPTHGTSPSNPQPEKPGNPRPLRRAMSLHHPSNLQIRQLNRRSVSPTFHASINLGSMTSHAGNDDVTSRALRSQPNKPTTPKPRKMSGSCSSLNKFTFRVSQQNIANEPVTTSRPASLYFNPADLVADVDGRVRSSAKNASIRRRMSLQLLKPSSRDNKADSNASQPDTENKRHSIAGLDMEKVSSAMARWSSNRSFRRSVRPLSEVQTVRWEVQAIPEHHEVSTSTNEEIHFKLPSTLPRPKTKRSSCAPTCGSITTETCRTTEPKSNTTDEEQCDNPRIGLIGSSFSQEDVSSPDDQDFPCRACTLHRPFSVIGGINTMPESLCHFYPSKYVTTGRVHGAAHMKLHSYRYIHTDRCRIRGSTISGISSESGYGTMTRNGPRLRTPDNDEEVFVNTSTQTADGTSSARAEGIFVEALWDHVTMDPDELGFKVGDVIRVNDMSNADWWWGEIDSAEGWFPATFVRILVNQQIRTDSNNSDVIISNYASSSQSEDEISVTSHEFSRVTSFNDFCQCTEQRSTTSVHCNVCGRPLTDATPASRTSIAHPSKQPEIVITKPPPSNTGRKSSITRDQIRTNVIREIINSEKVFVGHLKDVVQGYLTRCRNRSDMFSDEILNTLFGNIEDIYLFQREFAAELEASLDNVSTHATNIGNVFLKHKDGFCIYSEYCNNHPQAVAELAQLLTNKKFMHFFEACRLLQRMIDIPLDGFLLTPVQKICKYPLQLAELLKYTHPGHQDYEAVKSALEAMKGVARMINERKRKMENLRKISQWQASIVNWQGESVLSRSCELVHSGEIHALSQVKGKPKPRVAFLFDHQMILCKKDLLRRDLLYYKARIDLDAVEVAPIDPESPRSSHSGSDFHSSSSLGSCQGWKVTDTTTGESGLMYSKNQEDCGKWMKAFALERKIVRTEGTTSPLLNEALTLGLLRNSLPMSRKPKESGSQRLAPSYRNRMKMAQELQDYSNKQNSFASDKPSFFSSVAGKLTPFRRTNPRESSFVF